VTEPLELVITRVFDAPRNLVFEAWTRPEHLARWWAPEGFTLLCCEVDGRPGGSWVGRMRSAEGAEHVNLVSLCRRTALTKPFIRSGVFCACSYISAASAQLNQSAASAQLNQPTGL